MITDYPIDLLKFVYIQLLLVITGNPVRILLNCITSFEIRCSPREDNILFQIITLILISIFIFPVYRSD